LIIHGYHLGQGAGLLASVEKREKLFVSEKGINDEIIHCNIERYSHYHDEVCFTRIKVT